MLKTPPLHAKGRYTLRAPWSAVSTKIYSCIAIRSFADIYKLGKDVFKEYYQLKGLTEAEVAADAALGAHIVTLQSADGSIIYVPDTYIESYPNMSDVSYSHVVLSVSISAIPDYVDLTFLKGQISTAVSTITGLTPEVKENRAPTIGAVSPADHEVQETARLAAVTNRKTDKALYLEERAKNTLLLEKVEMLTKILEDNDLLP